LSNKLDEFSNSKNSINTSNSLNIKSNNADKILEILTQKQTEIDELKGKINTLTKTNISLEKKFIDNECKEKELNTIENQSMMKDEHIS